MLPNPARTVRCLLAALMLVTGLLGQAGHAALHAQADASAAWQAALHAERAWLAGEPDAAEALALFGGTGPHRHGGDPAEQHDGPDGQLAEHAHGVVFLAPALAALGPPCFPASVRWSLSCRLPGGEPGAFDRPPRGALTRA